MHLSSPYFIVPLIVVIFMASILFATSSKEDGDASHESDSADTTQPNTAP